ncbi:97a089b4-84f4-4283-8635-25d1d530ee09 [Thermothielavioides terrestris]|uniref:97a089b4-84f4-4283-8635-25d1d530ee09 n=1 Tax=Thermothielavioides terrestris TaxID=2587410 RepID=A0A446BAX1_9PEZI|nr:97a089b4-84f4-4283-8635-25d1d530ee09 [Thermothielavioides terrestris]
MAPLILHNVPDEELYVGDDGIQRPYAMVFSQDGSLRSRKMTHETGSFGKSTRRTRSKTATPARKEDPTIAAADKVFSSWLATQNQNAPQAQNTPATAQRRPSAAASVSSQSAAQLRDDAATPSQNRFQKQLVPTEVILRGYRSSQQQYAAINHYEQLAGRICEDYPREPPVESRRYKSELRDPAFTRRRALTPEERAKVNKADGGEHWVKVTFESHEAADAAIFASPQKILGHLVYAEPYQGIPPSRDEAIPDQSYLGSGLRETPLRRRHSRTQSGFGAQQPGGFNWSPPHSQASSSATADTMTVNSSTISSSTVIGQAATGGSGAGVVPAPQEKHDDEFCRVIPTVRKAKLLPVEQALLPAPSFTQRIANHIPFLRWFNGAMIGSEVPRTEMGEFDWNRASLYWKLMWWLDFLLGLFGGEIRDADKDD